MVVENLFLVCYNINLQSEGSVTNGETLVTEPLNSQLKYFNLLASPASCVFVFGELCVKNFNSIASVQEVEDYNC